MEPETGNCPVGSTETRGEVRQTLRKSSKLRHKSLIDPLFRKGNSLFEYPLKLVWRKIDDQMLTETFRDVVPDRVGPVQIMITVPKKKRRRAVDRVRMRRLVREAFRLNQMSLRSVVGSLPDIRTLSLAFIYVSDADSDWRTISRKMALLLKKLETRLRDNG